MNTANSSTSDLVNSKIRDIEAAANTFFTTLANDFNMAGYNSEVLKEYVPALVFTMYDGFYIYSPFENTLDKETADNLAKNPDAEYQAGEQISGLKPYIFYSCRYKKGSNTDVVITYALDNYITIQGIANGKYVNDAGYLINGITENGSTITYRGVTIEPEGELQEYIGNSSDPNTEDGLYPYIKINGAKYYYDKSKDDWFQLFNGERLYNQGPFKRGNNDMAYRYYKEAADFRKRIEGYGLTNLTPEDAVDSKGQPLTAIKDEDGNTVYDFVNSGKYKIFAYEENGVSIEEPDSNFNSHRMAVIRYVIESNLSVALANYNHYDNGLKYNFRMPKLAEEDWENILNNVSVISFLQGLSIGGKIYNGYSVINNNSNEEVVTENSIYLITTPSDGYFHRVTSAESKIISGTNLKGIFSNDFAKKNYTDETTRDIHYYHPQTELGCYNCYILQSNNNAVDNIYEYLDDKPALAKAYYTALGRERYSTYKVFRNPTEHRSLFEEAGAGQAGNPEDPTSNIGPHGLGDINDDGVVDTMTDTALLQAYLAGRGPLTNEQLNRADVNQDGVVDNIDYNLIMMYING